jgi:hypothetical protein
MKEKLYSSRITIIVSVFIGILIGAGIFSARTTYAHCDSLSGPVVTDARLALETGDVTVVLKWVTPENEEEIRAAFEKTLEVRSLDADAMELADMYFFETLVRLHRAGEGAPYTGLKPAGTDLGPAIAGADLALETGLVDDLIELITNDIAEGIRERFELAWEKKQNKDDSVEAGREYVEAYVGFVHYVERLSVDAEGSAGHEE